MSQFAVHYFALVSREPGCSPSTRMSHIYSERRKAKYDWCEYQAKRFRAGLGLETTFQMEEIFPITEGRFEDKNRVEVNVTDDEGMEA